MTVWIIWFHEFVRFRLFFFQWKGFLRLPPEKWEPNVPERGNLRQGGSFAEAQALCPTFSSALCSDRDSKPFLRANLFRRWEQKASKWWNHYHTQNHQMFIYDTLIVTFNERPWHVCLPIGGGNICTSLLWKCKIKFLSKKHLIVKTRTRFNVPLLGCCINLFEP